MCSWINRTLFCLFFAGILLVNPVTAQISPEDQHFIYPEYSKRISMDFKGAALADIFKAFSKESQQNYVVSNEIGARRVSLYLDKVPVEEALEQILASNDLEYEVDATRNIFVVRAKPVDKDPVITRIYPLKYASVTASKMNSTLKDNGGAMVSGLVEALKGIVAKGGGSVTESARTNSLIVTDVTSRFPAIEELLSKLDVPVPQILIEVEMLDISKATSDKIGAKWGDSPFSFTGASKFSLLPFDQTAILSKPGTMLSTDPEKLPYVIPLPGDMGNLDFTKMTLLIQFLKSQTDTRNLAKPRILTLNNETATISIDTDEVIGIKSQTQTGTTTSTSIEAERKSTGVFLTVTPQANMVTRDIIMAVFPKVIDTRASAIQAGTQTFQDPETRSSQSILKIHDGDTIIIGGLLRSRDETVVTKVPFLGDLPFIGMGFRHREKRRTDRELIIFITPHIIDENKSSSLHKKDIKLRNAVKAEKQFNAIHNNIYPDKEF